MPTLPGADAVARGWRIQLDRGLRVELPDPVLQAAVDAARPAAVLAGQAWKVDPGVVAVLEDWGLDAEAAVGWGRLTGRERRRIGRREPAPGSWARVRELVGTGGAPFLAAVRDAVVVDGDATITVLGDWPREWDGLAIDVRDAPDASRAGVVLGALARRAARVAVGRARRHPRHRARPRPVMVVDRTARRSPPLPTPAPTTGSA